MASEFRDQISCHDAEDPEAVVSLGSTDAGEDVEINRAALDCDLLIYVNLNYITMNGGWKSTAVGLSTYKSVRHHHRPDVLKIGSLIDPAGSGMHAAVNRMGEVLKKHVNLFQIETVINNSLWPGVLGSHLIPDRSDEEAHPNQNGQGVASHCRQARPGHQSLRAKLACARDTG